MPNVLTELIKKVFKRSPKTNSSNFEQSYELISPKFQNDPSYPNNVQYRGNSSNDNDSEISGGKRKYRKKLLLTALAFCFLFFIGYLMGFIKGRGVDMEEEFKKFVSKFDRNYSPHEHELRKKHFTQSLEELLTLKKDLLRSSLFGLTEFMDWSPEEKKKLFGTVPMKKSYDRKFVSPQNFERKVKRDQAPENFDWREHGVVTPVKNQRNCGSCWAFSSVSVVESAIARYDNHSILDLSEQNLVDCVDGNGCEGGEPREALSYISIYGIAVESDYPYNAKYSDCKDNAKKLNYTIDWSSVGQDGHKNDKLTHNLYAMGPLVHDIWVPNSMLYLASSGVYKPSEVECLDAERKGDGHSVAVVGYGVDSDSGEPYWIIKNSWGTNWGDRGYFKLYRGSGLCSMGDPMLAVLVTANH